MTRATDERPVTGVACRVAVEVATGWTAPDAPREVDTPALHDEPDLAAWLAALDTPDLRRGLHGRTLTQLLRGEPCVVVEERDGWVRVVAPWQPAPEDPRGYPCWVRRAHLSPADGPGGPPAPAGVAPDRAAVVDCARQFLGVGYLWGGTSPYGLDCSGLVHYCYRRAGVVVPRDAEAQRLAAVAVPLGEEQPGDLYFFAHADGRAFHVGFVTDRLRMLESPESGAHVTDSPLSERRRETLFAAGRFLA